MVFGIKKIVNILYYSFFLILFDLLLHFFVKSDSYNIFHIISYDLFIGISFSSLLNSFNDKKVKTILLVFINGLVFFYILLVMVEVICYRSFSNLFPINTIFMNAKNVFSLNGDNVILALMNNFLVFIMMLALLICELYFSKIVYLNNNNTFSKKTNVIIILAISLIAYLGIFSINDIIIGWGDNLKTNGLKAAIANEFSKENNITFVYDNEVDEDNIDTTIEDENLVEEDSELDKYNIINYNFETLIENEKRNDFNEINKYINSKTPTKKNDYTGLFKGKNLIMICAEAFNSHVVDEELFPTLYRLINNGFTLKSFYQPQSASSTSSGEYAFMTGMIPTSNDTSFMESASNDMGFTISKKLKEMNYKTISFHNAYSTFYGRDVTHSSHMGFDHFYAYETGMEEVTGAGFPNDKLMLEKTIDIFDKDEPFLAYYMTYTGHMPYKNGIKDDLFKEYYQRVHNKYGDKFSKRVKNYIAKTMYLEEGLRVLIEKLEEKNILNDTVICLVPDHYPYGLRSIEENMEDDDLVALYGTKNVLSVRELLDVTYPVLFCGSLENEDKKMRIDIHKPTCSIDLTPTLLNLFNIEFDSRLYPGRDIFDDNPGVVIYQDGRYITLDGIYKVTNWSDKKDMTSLDTYVLNAINYCRFNIKEDYFSYINNKEKEIIKYAYLTFEGGPTDNTEKILEILKANDVNACFFVTGDKKLSLIPKIMNGGNTIGLYSLTSNTDVMYQDDETFINSIMNLITDINSVKSMPINTFRFPGGSNNKSIMEEKEGLLDRLKIHLKNMQITYLDYNIDASEVNFKDKETLIKKIREGIKDKNVVWIRLNDDENSVLTVSALQEIIDVLKENSFKMRAWNSFCDIYHFS